MKGKDSSGNMITMRGIAIGLMMLLMVSGCACSTYFYPTTNPNVVGTPLINNPIFISGTDSDYVWETVVDVVDDYFRIETELRPTGDCVSEGVLRTFPLVGATLLEPWREDSADAYERLESTLQTIRRFSVVHVRPVQGGFSIEVDVYKELENAARPLQSTASAATFHYDTGMTRIVDPAAEQETHQGWIPKGRDQVLEQRILGQLQWRFSGHGAPVTLQ